MTTVLPQGTPAAPDGTVSDLVTTLRATFESGRTRSLEWRDGQLAALGRLLDERENELVEALVADLRRSPFEAALFDVISTRPEVTHARKNLRGWMRPQPVKAPMNAKPGKAWVRYEPLGVSLVIGAWNYPVHLTLAPLVGALAAGNCVVLKPSEIAPATSAALARLVPLYLDPEAVAVVEGDAEATQALIAQGFDHVFFTGSPAVGRLVMAAAAPHLSRVTLELGGKCPAIVTASATLDVAARRIAFGKLVNAGQTCVAPDYVLVDRAVRDEFIELLTATVARFSERKAVPIVNSRHAARVAELVRTAGGRTVLGGGVDVDAATAMPTIIVDPDPGAPILHEEIFGPVLPVVTVDGLDEAIAHVRRGTKPLASYLFTEEAADETAVVEQISAGGQVVNHVMLHMAVNDLPFGGVGTSGMGSYHGRWGFETFSHAKAVLSKPSGMDLKFVYPPYGRLVQALMRRMM